MCGLVGIAGNLELKDEALMKRLLWFDYWRGPDSTGMAAIDKNGEVQIAKIHSGPTDLFDMNRFKKALNYPSSLVWLGHNRAATKGRINLANTHPFQFQHIVGAHNGTLDGWCHNTLKKDLGEDYEVDSQAIFASIAKLGTRETISKLSGAWSLTYVNLKNGTLNFLRNSARPLWYGFLKEKDGTINKLIWASEEWIIDAAIHGYPGELWADDKGNSYFSTKEDTHFSFDIAKLRAGSKTRPKPKVTEMKGDDRPLVSSGSSNGFGWAPSSGHYSPWNDDNWEEDPNNVVPFMPKTSAGRTRNSTTLSRTGSGRPPEIKHFDGSVNEPFAGRISRARFNQLVEVYRGCCWCGGDIKWETAEGVTIFDHDDKILCPKCSTSGYSKTNRIYVRA